MKAEVLGYRSIHDGWSRFGVVTVRLASGVVVEREIEQHGESVGVLPYDPERRVATLVSELRVPLLYAFGEHAQLEVPAGVIDGGVPEENGRREALEEVGLRLKSLEFICAAFSCASLSTERVHLYLAAYELSDRVAPGGGAEGEHEDIEVIEMPLAQLARLLDAGELRDLKTVALVFALRTRRPELFL
ncbi:nudix-type nucleoside diphosphatase, YffH/AdpP family [Methylobacterium sp. 275MFSha3.1]|uniref:NUDIX domain-containing protein n=1 Tax=Methylobacterium sp. 275MFSha3.1 TaxID=1502746 RepID=UPI0008A7EA31|nr:NUDIX hydrolase [Methylobacterium sp. 275MFSha3.1]SEI12399.1 nudix-type nucleoside diphosphatase, YffH/AdpP family [Methylobacterium sp. 275MFSha3.1]